jgi:thioredoxin-like negative regulator of GroEL
MAFLKKLLSRTSKDPTEALRAQVEANPNDAKLPMDLAHQLRARGAIEEAVLYARRSATVHRENGFSQKALATLKAASGWAPASAELLEDLAALYLELKLKEDARQVFLQLKRLYSESRRAEDKQRVESAIAELGPGR